jgi:hypothetical protein
LARSKDEYAKKSLGWFSNLNCPEYLREADKHLIEEEKRADYYLQPDTKVKLLNVVQTEVIEKKADELTQKQTGCDQMFDMKKLDELKLMYKVFVRVETTIKYIINKMNPYIENRGKKIVDDETLQKNSIEFT